MTYDHSERETRLNGRSRVLASVLDQALSSATNFVLLIAVARASTPQVFGYFAIAYGVLTLGLALQRSSIGVPLGLDLPTDLSLTVKSTMVRRSMGWSLCLGVAVGTVILAGAIVAGLDTSLGNALWPLALAAPVTMAQDTLRYVAAAVARPGAALLSDALWLLSVAFALPFGDRGSFHGLSFSPSLYWCAGAALGLCVLAGRLRPGRPSLRGSRRMLTDDPRRVHLALDAVLGSTASILVAVIVAAMIDPTATAALRGSSTIFGPVSILISVVSLAVTPELSRRGIVDGARFVTVYCVVLAALIVVWCAVLLGIPDTAGAALLGATWIQAQILFPFAAVEMLCLCGWSWSVAFLRVAEATRRALHLRVAHALLYLSGATMAAAWFSTASAVMVAMALSGLAVALISMIFACQIIRDARSRAALLA